MIIHEKKTLNIYLIGLWFLAWVTMISSYKTLEQLNWYSKTRIVQTQIYHNLRYSTVLWSPQKNSQQILANVFNYKEFDYIKMNFQI